MSTHILFAATFVCTQVATVLAEDRPAVRIEWNALAPAEANQFSDPFAELSRDQLGDLSYVVRIQGLIESEKLSADGSDAAEAAEIARRLSDERVDIPWLMAQRERVRDLREQQAQAVTEVVRDRFVGTDVTLTGYILPLKITDDRVSEFFLVSSVATCSHGTAPPPNQVVYVQCDEGVTVPDNMTPVRVTGRIEAQQTLRTLPRPGRPLQITAAYVVAPKEVDVTPNE